MVLVVIGSKGMDEAATALSWEGWVSVPRMAVHLWGSGTVTSAVSGAFLEQGPQAPGESWSPACSRLCAPRPSVVSFRRTPIAVGQLTRHFCLI